MGLSVLVLAAVGRLPAEAATPTATSYSTCKVLNKKYPIGIRKSGDLVNRHTSDRNKPLKQRRIVDSKKRPVSASIYQANKHLDFDKDGVACER